MAKSKYEQGRDKEIKVARSLRGKGASVKVSKGSKGAADLRVTFSTGTKWNIQVKSSRKGVPASPSAKDSGRLKQGATKSGATPVIAKVTPRSTEYRSARSGRKLTPPQRKRE
ncbi:hypothetical protein ES703_07598 [subsurface metagenome]